MHTVVTTMPFKKEGQVAEQMDNDFHHFLSLDDFARNDGG